jgi:hypothetical protein
MLALSGQNDSTARYIGSKSVECVSEPLTQLDGKRIAFFRPIQLNEMNATSIPVQHHKIVIHVASREGRPAKRRVRGRADPWG